MALASTFPVLVFTLKSLAVEEDLTFTSDQNWRRIVSFWPGFTELSGKKSGSGDNSTLVTSNRKAKFGSDAHNILGQKRGRKYECQ